MVIQAASKCLLLSWLVSTFSGCAPSASDMRQTTPADSNQPVSDGTGGTVTTPSASYYHFNPALSSGENDPLIQGYALGVPVDQNDLSTVSLSGGFTWSVPEKIMLYGATSAPVVDDIVQGVIGDCYLDAAIGAILNTPGGANGMAGLIAPTAAAGTFTVSFYQAGNANAGPVPVVVNAAQLRDIDGYVLGNQVSNENAIWTQLVEKAYVVYAGQADAMNTNATYPVSSIDDHGAAEGVGYATIKAALFALTGRMSTNMKIENTSEADIKAALTQAANVPTVANTSSSDSTVGLSAPHVYTVVGFDSASDTVTVRDPHGVNTSVQAHSDGHGTFSISYAAFQNHVDAVTSLPQ